MDIKKLIDDEQWETTDSLLTARDTDKQHVAATNDFILLSERTMLERCCVHNMSPFVSSSGLSPGSREQKFRGPRSASIARSQVWLSLPAGHFQSGGTCRIHAARAQ